MIFTQIEDDAKKSGKAITNIFKQAYQDIRLALSSNTGIEFNAKYTSDLNADKDALDDYSDAIKKSISHQDAFNNHIKNASPLLQEFVKTSKQLTPDAFEIFAQKDYITQFAQSKSWGTVKTLINEYNSGMANCKLTQTEFLEAIKKSNTGLYNYLNGLGKADASLGGYIKQLFSAKAATIGMTIATTALNAAFTMGISALVTLIATAISDAIHYEEKLIEKSEEAANTIESLSGKFKNTQKTVSNTAKRFAELAQSVDLFTGKNKGLSTEEYEEFLELSNELADTFPTLTRIYDENGNAIVQLTGDTDSMVSSLEALLDVQRQIMNQKIAAGRETARHFLF